MIHAFGDSMTKYPWPCWPEWLGKYSGQSVNNLGYPGYGNGNHYWNLVDIISDIKSDDQVIMMWSQNHRIISWYERD